MMPIYLALLAAVISHLGWTQAVAAADDVKAIEDSIVGARSSIARGIFELNTRFKDSQQARELSASFIIRFDGTNKLIDKTIDQNGHRERSVASITSGETKRFVSSFMTNGVVEDSNLLQIVDTKTTRDDFMLRTTRIPDVRMLGLMASDFLNGDMAFNSFVNRGDVQRSTKTEDEFQGLEAIKLTYELKDNRNARNSVFNVWVDRKFVSKVLGVEWAYDVQGIHFVDRIVSSVMMLDAGEVKLPFPKSCDFTRLRDGEEIRSEHTEVRVVEINKPLGEELFSIEGMSVPIGTAVMKLPREDGQNEPVYWNGKKIAPNVTKLDIDSGNRSTTLLVVFGLFPLGLIVGLIFIRRAERTDNID